MSASWVTTLKGMMDRGTGDLTTVDNAVKKKVLTEPERVQCYDYWYTTHPTLTEGLGLDLDGRQVSVHWTAPSTGKLLLTRTTVTGGTVNEELQASASPHVIAEQYPAEIGQVNVSVAVPRPDTGAPQRAVTATVALPPPPAPEPTPEPETPAEPEPTPPPAPEPTPEPETPAEPEPTPEPAPEAPPEPETPAAPSA